MDIRACEAMTQDDAQAWGLVEEQSGREGADQVAREEFTGKCVENLHTFQREASCRRFTGHRLG
jgi:hypothetical protein